MNAPPLNRQWVLACALAVAITVTARVGSALADSVSYTIGVPNSAISAYTGPYATVDVSLNTITNVATFTFTALSYGGNTYLMVDSVAADVNVNGAFTFNPSSAVLTGPWDDWLHGADLCGDLFWRRRYGRWFRELQPYDEPGWRFLHCGELDSILDHSEHPW